MHRLKPALKSYSWGLPISNSLAAQFDPETANKCDICAEAWWGSHPAGPARYKSTGVPLKDIPFLLKVISVGKPLSLQIHPDSENAAKLHFKFPQIYVDSNPKPEIAIAITPFTALCGFLPDSIMKQNTSILNLPASLQTVLTTNKNKIVEIIEKARKLNSTVDYLASFYPNDPAVLAPLYLNTVSLQPGEALVIPPLQPHCYLAGQAVECMTPSDNVIRAGLTGKMCDIPLFFTLASTNCTTPTIIKPQTLEHIYKHDTLNFVLQHVTENSQLPSNAILLITSGSGKIETDNKDTEIINQGDSFLIINNSTLHGRNVQGFIAVARTT